MTSATHLAPRTIRGLAYVAAVGLAGAVCLALGARDLLLGQASLNWLVLAALTWASGWFAIKVPAIPATIYVSETFVFALVLLFGPGPAVVTVVIDGALISLRRRDRDLARCVFNMAEPAVSVTAASAVFRALAGTAPLAVVPAPPPELPVLLLPVVGMAAVYFLLNSSLTAIAVASEAGIPPHRVWQKHYLGLALNTLGGALLGLLLAMQAPALSLGGTSHLADRRILSGLGVVVPLLLISYLTFRTSVARVEDANQHLKEMNRLYLSTVETLATAIDAKDQVTSHHIRRVQHYALSLAHALGVEAERDLKAIEAAALLHDLGKLSVPEYILNKPGKLTAAEFERIKLHTIVGARIVSQIDFPYPVVPIVRHHHEHWDGTGYPDGLKGEAIPLGARIMGVVDCYDALTSDRPYRVALSGEEALRVIVERRGNAYDPRVVDTFLEIVPGLQSGEENAAQPAAAADASAAAPALLHGEAAPSSRAVGRARHADARPNPDALLLLCSLIDGLAGRAALDDVAEAVSRHLRRMVPAALVVFYLPDQSGTIVAKHASGTGEAEVSGRRIPIGSGLSGWVAAHRRVMVNSDPALDLGTRVAASLSLESALATPLIAAGELVGVLTLYAAGRDTFSEDHRLLVDVAARQVASAVDHALRFDVQRTTALLDRATGLPNGQSLNRLMSSGSFAAAAPAPAEPALGLGILCFVVGRDDGLPASHEQVVLRVADAIRRSLRASDLIFRYSDDELVVVMPDTTPGLAEQVAQRVAAGVVDNVAGGADLPVQIGMALAPRDGESIERLLRSARGRLETQRWRDLVAALSSRAETDAGGAEA